MIRISLIRNKDRQCPLFVMEFLNGGKTSLKREAGTPLSQEEKQQALQVYLDILEALIQAKANVHLWDAEEFYGPLWDAASSACAPAVQRLLDEKVDPNT